MKKKQTDELILKRKKILRISLVILIVLLLLLTFNALLKYLVLFILIFANYFFAIAKRKISRFVGKYLFGIELIMISTVLTSVSFGSLIGATMGALLMVVNYLAERRFSRYFFVTVPLYMLIGYTAYFFRTFDVFFVGAIITIIYNVLVFILASFFEPNRRTLLIFNLVNIVFNLVLFSTFGKILEKILI
jgi:hypothetical protein